MADLAVEGFDAVFAIPTQGVADLVDHRTSPSSDKAPGSSPDILLCSYDLRFQIVISSGCHSFWRNDRLQPISYFFPVSFYLAQCAKSNIKKQDLRSVRSAFRA